MRFRPEQHLSRQNDIRAVREQGRRLDCRAFTLWWRSRPNTASTGPRVCVIASTNAVGHAVLRNRAKRRLREVFRAEQNRVPRDCDLLLIARVIALKVPLADLQQKFAEACAQIERVGQATANPP